MRCSTLANAYKAQRLILHLISSNRTVHSDTSTLKMNSALQISCLLLVLGCLLGSGHSQSEAEFAAKSREISQIFGNPSVDKYTKARNLPKLIAFYEKYSSRLHLTAQKKNNINNAIKQYRAQQNHQVDGVSAQGGWVSGILKAIADAILGGNDSPKTDKNNNNNNKNENVNLINTYVKL